MTSPVSTGARHSLGIPEGALLLRLIISVFLVHACAQPLPPARTAEEARQAAEKGDSKAQYELGRLYLGGHGVPQDYVEAAAWFRKSAEQGHATAQTFLGMMYEEGWAGPKDLILAHMWYNLAASQESGEAHATFADLRNRVAAKLSPEQLAEAQRMAREWNTKFEKRGGK